MQEKTFKSQIESTRAELKQFYAAHTDADASENIEAATEAVSRLRARNLLAYCVYASTRDMLRSSYLRQCDTTNAHPTGATFNEFCAKHRETISDAMLDAMLKTED